MLQIRVHMHDVCSVNGVCNLRLASQCKKKYKKKGEVGLSRTICSLDPPQINHGELGLQNGKIVGPKLFVTPLTTGLNFFTPPPFKEWKLPLFNMA